MVLISFLNGQNHDFFKFKTVISNYNFKLNFKFFYTYEIMLFHLKYFNLFLKTILIS